MGASLPVTFYTEIKHINQMGHPMAGDPLGGQADQGARCTAIPRESACPRRRVASNEVDGAWVFPEFLMEPSLVRGGGDGLLLAGAMFGAVPLEVIGPGEGLAAVVALVGPLPVMHANVLGQL